MADAATWSKRVAAWRATGRSAREFSAGKGYAPSTLTWWSSRLAHSTDRVVSTATPRIARVVRAMSPAPARTAIVIEVGAARVTIERGVDRETLELVLDVLRAQSGRAR